ncbi:MAG: hypothetical protein K8R53_02285, partial [Bacteroidales bacterium]|nr:hypothetical protein [Bacteroidales bacterium]
MKKNVLLVFLLLFAGASIIGQVSVNTDNSDPDPAAMLDVKSTDKGVLIPRVALVSTTDPISITKPDGLLVWNTSTTGNYPEAGFYYWDGSDWKKISTGSGAAGSYEIVDSDNDTRVTVEYNTDEDTIRFFVAGNEVMKHDGKTLHMTDAYSNVFIGRQAGEANTDGSLNIAVGGEALLSNTTGDSNIAIGGEALERNDAGNGNIAIGNRTLFKNDNGFGNTAVGSQAGYQNISGDNNVFLGKMAGYSETGDKKLYIENSPAVPEDALIYGDFDLDQLSFNGKVGINTITPTTELDVEGDIRSSNLAGSGNRLVQADGSGVFQPLSVPDSVYISQSPQYISSFGYYDVNNLEIVNDIAFTSSINNTQRFASYDISNPNQPIMLDYLNTTVITDFSISGNYAYQVSTNGYLRVYDVSDPSNIQPKGTNMGNLSWPMAIELKDSIAIVTSRNDDKLVIFNINDPNNPVKIGETSDDLNGPEYLAIKDNFAYVVNAINRKLVVFDFSNPTSPVKVADTVFSDYYPMGITINDNYAYVPYAGNETEKIFDISDPSQFVIINELVFSNNPTSLSYSKGYLFSCSSYNNETIIYNVKDPNNIIEVSEIQCRSWDAVVKDNNVYLIAESSSDRYVKVYNVFNSAFPSIGNNGELSWNSVQENILWEKKENNNTIYYNNGLVGINTDNPQHWLDVDGNIHTDAYLMSDRLTGSGNRLIQASSQGWIKELTVPENARVDSTADLVATYPEGDGYLGYGYLYKSIFIRNNISYVTRIRHGASSYSREFATMDISDPESPVQLDLISISNNVSTDLFPDVYVSGDYAFITENGYLLSNLKVYDISDPGNIIYIAGTSQNLFKPTKLFVSQDYAFVLDESNGLVIFDVSDLTSGKTFIGSSNTLLDNPSGIVVEGDYAYVTSFNNDMLVIIDVSDKSSPTNVGSSTSGLDGPSDIKVENDYAFISSQLNNKLVVFDLSNKTSPYKSDEVSDGLNEPRCLTKSGDYVFVGSDDGARFIGYNVSNPWDIYKVTESESSGCYQANDLWAFGDYLYLCCKGCSMNRGIGIYRLFNNATPTIDPNGNIAWTSSDNTMLWQKNNENNIYCNTGYVGIGTENPSEQLELSNSQNAWLRINANNDGMNPPGNNERAYLQFTNNSDTDHDGLIYLSANSSDATLSFEVENQFAMGIHDGNVGINTNTPTEKLDVNGQTRLRSLTTDNTLDSIVVADGDGVLYSRAASTLMDNLGNHTATQNLLTNGHWLSGDGDDEGLFVASDGNIGLGTSSPNELLEIGGNGRVFIGDGGGANRSGLLIDGNETGDHIRLQSFGYGTSPDIDMKLNPGGGNVIINETDGYVGIGTSSPEYKLDVRGNRIQIKEDATGDWMALRTDGNGLDLQFEGSNCYFQSTTDGEHILLNPNRNSYVGIRTTTPDVPLHVGTGSDVSLAGGGYLVTGSVTSRNIALDDNEIMARNNGAIENLHLNRDGG